MRVRARFILKVSCLFGAAACLEAQSTTAATPPALAPGTPASSYALSGLDNINYFNGNLVIRVPLATIAARGSAALPVSLPVSQQWTAIEYSPGNNSLLAPQDSVAAITNLPAYGPGIIEGPLVMASSFTSCSPPSANVGNYIPASSFVSYVVWTAPDGTQTYLWNTSYFGVTTPQNACSYTFPADQNMYRSSDGSEMTFVNGPGIEEGTLTMRDGTQYHRNSVYQVDTMTDRNGNQTTFGTAALTATSVAFTATDSAGRPLTDTATNSGSPDYNPVQDTLAIPGYSLPVTVNYALLQNLLGGGDTSVTTPGCLFPELAGSTTTPYNPYLVSSITMPDGHSYTFKYNKYGEVAAMTLPTGGVYQYTWPENTGCSDPTGASGVILWPSGGGTIVRRPSKRVELSDGVHISAQTLFTVVTPAIVDPNHPGRSTTTLQVDFQDALGNELRREMHSFYGDPTSAPSVPTTGMQFAPWTDGLEFQTTVYDGSTAAWQTPTSVWQQQTNVWQQRPCNASTEFCTGVVAGSDTSRLHDPQLCQANRALETGAVSGTVMLYDAQFNNQTDLYEYGYGNTAAAGASCPSPSSSFFRHTQTAYNAAPAYTAAPVNLVSLPLSRTVYDTIGQRAQDIWTYDGAAPQPAAATIGHNAAYGTLYLTRGNVTTHQEWLDSSSTYPAETFVYDTTGSLLQYADFLGNATSYCYGSPYVSPTTITDARGGTSCGSAGTLGTTSITYDPNLLQPLTATDENGVNTSYVYNDPLGRVTSVVQALGTAVASSTQYSYPSPNQTVMLQDENSTGDGALKTVTKYDGLGRQTETDNYETSTAYIATTTSYDSLGRTYTSTNPSRPGDGLNYTTTYTYDALNRPLCATTADSSSTCAAYSGNVTTTTQTAADGPEARVITADAAGRVTSVQEDPTGNNYTTNYTLYDGLNNLRTMTQGAQSRTFSYDSLGRLTSAVNPENGTTSYAYDADSNLIYRQDNAGNQTCSQYDQVNRITRVLYYTGAAQIGTPCGSITNNTSTPTVTYAYDAGPAGADVSNAHGRLTQVLNSSANELITGYDELGRIAQSSEVVGGTPYNFLYGYNFAGELTSMTYPSGRVVTTGYDGAGRIRSVTGIATTGGSPTTYFSGASYWPHGAIQNFTFGNQVTRSYSFNLQLQASEIKDSLNGGSLLDLQYYYGGSTTLGGSSATNNGSPTQLNEAAPRGGLNYAFTQTNHFDGLNRLVSASDSGGWSHSYSYDRYGNMWLASSTGPPQSSLMPTLQTSINAATNRVSVSGVSYDSAGLGRVTAAGSSNLSYDAESRVVSGADNTGSGYVTTYLFDGFGQRVSKTATTGTSVTTNYVYDAFGNLAAEYTSAPVANPPCLTCYVSDDAVGNTRMVTDQTGAVQGSHDYYPFGAEVAGTTAQRSAAWGTTDSLSQKFTGQERDTETGLDHFPARHFASAMGRFAVPDPAGNFVADVTNPQSWNMYSYVRNNPLVNVDRWGLDCVYTYGATQSDPSITVGVETGSCSSDAGTYVPGTIDTNSLTLNNGTIGYSYSPYSGADLGTGTIGLPENEFPGIQGQANYFGAQQIVNGAGPVVNTLGWATVGFVGGAMAAGTLSGTAATGGIVSQTSGYLGKSAARALASRLATSAAQAAAAASAVSKATTSSSVQVFKQGTDLVVSVIRAGAVDGYQEIEYIIDQAGNKQVVQKAFNNAGSLIHYDPK